MSGEPIAMRLEAVLRRTALEGSSRPINHADQLGEAGIGLDSLALVQFLAAVEKEFNARIPTDVWSRVDRLSLEDCVAVLNDLGGDASGSKLVG